MGCDAGFHEDETIHVEGEKDELVFSAQASGKSADS
jgi:hypothetical protein